MKVWMRVEKINDANKERNRFPKRTSVWVGYH